MVHSCLEQVARLYGPAAGEAPEIRFDLRGQAAGQASAGNLIRLNKALLDANPEQWRATVIHELAHIVTWRLHPRARAHGRQWREINQSLGGVDQVCHQMDTRSHRTRTLEYFCYRTGAGAEVWISSIRHRRAQNNLRRWGQTGYLTIGGEPISYWTGRSQKGPPEALASKTHGDP